MASIPPSLGSDKRTDPRIAKVLNSMGLGVRAPKSPVHPISSTTDAKLSFIAAAEVHYTNLYDSLFSTVEPLTALVNRSEVVIKGVDNNDITLYIHRPLSVAMDVLLPCVFHIHGGGMAIFRAADSCYEHIRNVICLAGVVCIGVEFRNSAGKLGAFPFPAGLNDCYSALQYINNHKSELGISSVILNGESGGGNLCLSLTILAKRQNALKLIQGTYVCCPYISGAYNCVDERRMYPSLEEFDGYYLDVATLGVLAAVYTPNDQRSYATNCLAWPCAATTDDLTGLPPHVIHVNELDPLYSEGVAYYHKLLEAGVDCRCITIHGTPHGGDLSFPNVTPSLVRATVQSIISFSNS